MHSNASLSIVHHLITNWPFDGSQGNNEGLFISGHVQWVSTVCGLTLIHGKFDLKKIKHTNNIQLVLDCTQWYCRLHL